LADYLTYRPDLLSMDGGKGKIIFRAGSAA
jgi:hypothetical protein